MPPLVDDLSPSERLAVLRAGLRNDLLLFSFKVFQLLSAGQPFQLSWHHEVITDALDRVARGEIKRLIICAPPRTGKSTIASVAWPAFLIGRNPSYRIIHASYASDLGAVFSNQFRRVVADPFYRELFGKMRIDPRKNTESEVATTAGGFRLSLSTGGSLTGRGGDIIIIDDSLKAADAFSETRRDSVNDWYRNTVVSRLDDKRTGVIVLVMQRIHQDDLVGFVTGLSDDWHVLNLKAIAEEHEVYKLSDGGVFMRRPGEALHPEREPLEILERLRQQLGPDNFSAQYQQAPIPPGGAMIKRAWLQRYDVLPNPGYKRIVQSWDTANKGGGENDYSVCVTALVHQSTFYILDVHRGRYDYPSLKEKAFALAHRYQPTNILIEDAGVGTALIAEMRYKRTVTPILAAKDKPTRMSIASDKIPADAVAPYTKSAFPKTFATWGTKGVKRIDTLRRQAAETAAAKHECNRIEVVELSERSAPPNRPIVFVQCANGERFYLSEADVGAANLRSEASRAKDLDPALLEVQCFDAVQSILRSPSSFSRSWSPPRTNLSSSGSWVIEFDFSAQNGLGNTVPQTGRCIVTSDGRIEATSLDR